MCAGCGPTHSLGLKLSDVSMSESLAPPGEVGAAGGLLDLTDLLGDLIERWRQKVKRRLSPLGGVKLLEPRTLTLH